MKQSASSSNNARQVQPRLAVVGMSGRFPGAPSMDDLWQLMLQRRDAIRPVPAEKWDANQQLDPQKSVQAVGGFLEGVDQFDPTFFGISPREAEDMDPQQRLMLEASWTALEDGGQRPEVLAGKRIGVYVGASWHDYEILRKENGAPTTQHSIVGNALDVVSARVSYFYGFKGPSLTVETGCSSGMVALHIAAQALASGEIEGALVGGVNLVMAPDVSIGLTHFGGLSAVGRCQAFSASADGFVRGEGIVAFYLKRLDDAVADGDRIHAVIVASAVNNDGGGDSLVTPSPAGQEDLLSTIYSKAGIPLEDVLYIEAHGTGTAVGDPIEAGAIGRVLGRKRAEKGLEPIILGSVKTNIGHLEAAAGLAGLSKAIMAVEKRQVPANLHSDVLNPSIDFAALGLKVAKEPTPLPADKPFYVGVNSFGWGGTNAHIVLTQAPERKVEAAQTTDAPVLLALSGHSEAALKERARQLMDVLASGQQDLRDIAGTLAWRRGHLMRRVALVGNDAATLAADLEQWLATNDEAEFTVNGTARKSGKVAFVFPGQGSQWADMGVHLLKESPAFASTMEHCAAALKPLVDWDLIEVISGAAGTDWLDRVDIVQPVLWAMMVSLAALWREAGIVPDVVVGHSQGEVAAATVAGILSFEDAARVVSKRSSIIRGKAGRGLMLAVDLDLAGARAALEGFEDQISIAVSNGPRSTVLSGDAEAVMTLKELLDAEETFNRLIKVDYASHSHHMDEFKEELHAALTDIQPMAGDIRLVSTVDIRDMQGAELDATYWVRNLREPVMFADVMTGLFAEGVTHVIEVAPHKGLAPAIEQLAADQPDPPIALSTMLRDMGSLKDVVLFHARAYAAGLSPFGLLPKADVALPAYPWQRSRYWIGAPRRKGSGRSGLEVELLPSSKEPDAWEGVLEIGVEDNPWLVDHKVHEAVVFPGAGMMALALAAARARTGVMPAQLSAVKFMGDLTIADEPVRASLTVQDTITDGGTVTLRSLPRGSSTWTDNATARFHNRLSPTETRPFPEYLLGAEALSIEDFYSKTAARGIHYGPAFQGIRQLFQNEADVLAEIALPKVARASARPHGLHPALWDAALQSALALFPGDATVVPVAVAKVAFFTDPQEPVTEVYAHATVRNTDSDTQHYDIFLYNGDKSILASMEGIALHVLDQRHDDGEEAGRSFRLSFVPAPRQKQASPASWIIYGRDEDGADALADALTHAGGKALRVQSGPLPDKTDAAGVVYMAPCARSGIEAQKRGLFELSQLVKAAGSLPSLPQLAIVTANARTVEGDSLADAGAGLYWGFLRVLRREHPELQGIVLDIDPSAPSWADESAAELLSQTGEDQVVLRQEKRWVGRLSQTKPQEEPASTAWKTPAQPFRLVSARPGFWDGLEYRPLARTAPGKGEVEVAVKAAALNFIDVMKAMGTYPGLDEKSSRLGGECAGEVVALGEGVTEFAVGDRVVACTFGSFASHVTVDVRHARRIPAHVSDADAAALPLVMATAWYGLIDLADLEAGETVLIHSATGGLGLAAIQIARMRGAQVIATAGSEDKRQILRDMGIDHVFDSRSLDWVDAVKSVTEGRGVDVVLNSLTGAAIPLGLESLAEDGRFIEVGKKDIYGGRSINLGVFKGRISISAVDLAGLMERRPKRFARLMHDVWQAVDAGKLSVLPVMTYSFADAAEALRTMAKGNHVGKFVLTTPESVAHVAPEPLRAGRYRSDATYVLSGGLGALGLSLASHLVEHGAGAIALLGRSAPTIDASSAIEALRAKGADVRSFAVDVGDAVGLESVLHSIRTDMKPIRGVVHAAGLLDDALIVNLTPEQVERVLRPKVDGAIHLDRLTRTDPLDLFVLFSSAASLFGNAGQAVYASGNAFLDTLAEVRRLEGLPALAVQWGPFAEIGLAAKDDIRGARLEERGMGSFTAQEGWNALTRYLLEGEVQVGYVPLNLRQWFEAYPDTAAQSSWQLLLEASKSGGQATTGQDFKLHLEAAPEGERLSLAEDKVRELAGRVLRLDPASFDSDVPFKSLGLDSLMGLELRNRLEASFGLKLSPTLLWTYGNTKALSTVLCQRVFAEAA
ncbi:type I polyketide synthase [Allorhizobium terrae]|uniref:SDR family NAD(P)-dependent oxidoreductase n=1 Tax=Allorhizobium terrae TaxID=1848972 RepID=A0A4S3ZUI2_9HYPH|nr:type I polyketide synthase [Allorhizobium terrae]THF49231.1 SDR family NAD(P)-dependent oxidoreductase [Allorhizobium terrae]